MKMRTLLSSIMISIFVLSSTMSLYAKDISIMPVKVIASNPSTKAQVIVAKEIVTETPMVSYKVIIPKVEGLADTNFQENLNKTIMTKSEEYIAWVEDLAKKQFEYSEKMGYKFNPYQVYINYETKQTSNNLDTLSFTFTRYAYTGGTGMPVVDYYNIDTKQNKLIPLSELFIDGFDYKSFLNKIIAAQIKLKKIDASSSFFDGKAGFNSIDDNHSYYLKDNSLVLCFSKYSIAPGYMGNPEFKIPFYQLNSYLKDTVPLVLSNNYYNFKYNFKMKIPPIWKDKITLKEVYSSDEYVTKVDFIYTPQNNPEQVLLSLTAHNTGSFKGISKKAGVSNLIVAQTEAYAYVAEISQVNPYVSGSKEATELINMRNALDGINDLFKLEIVSNELARNINIIEQELQVLGKTTINNTELSLSNQMYRLSDSTIMIPLRQISEALGYEVIWQPSDKSILVQKDNNITKVKINSSTYESNGQNIALSHNAEIKHNSTFVPLEFVSKILTASVSISNNGWIEIQ